MIKRKVGRLRGGRRFEFDYAQIAAMTVSGCSVAIISKRLGCSEATVRRALTDRGFAPGNNALVGTEKEWVLWSAQRRMGASFDEIGYRFGFTGEHIRQSLKPLRKV